MPSLGNSAKHLRKKYRIYKNSSRKIVEEGLLPNVLEVSVTQIPKPERDITGEEARVSFTNIGAKKS